MLSDGHLKRLRCRLRLNGNCVKQNNRAVYKELDMRNKITASEGKILTNGEIYGIEIFLADGVNPNDFYEISIKEYEKIMLTEDAENGTPVEEG